MTKWTSEQLEAIEKSGSNIIVSAGAGSGKTAVLSERVLHKLKNKVHINELLILTFTKAAAEEMKDRIRSKIKNEPNLEEELYRIDTAYITTFDSFALSILKKYHYLLNLPKDIKVTDESIVNLKKIKIMDEVFELKYKEKEPLFLNFIKSYSLKNDKQVRKMVLNIANKIENYIDKNSYLNFIKNDFFEKENIDKIFDNYREYIINHQRYVNMEYESITNYFDSDYLEKLDNVVLPIINAKTLDELYAHKSFKLPQLPRGSSEEAKEIKKNLKKSLDSLYEILFSAEEEMIKNIVNTKDYVLIIIDIIEKYYNFLEKYKKENDIFTFQDIALLSIKILKENESARLYLKNFFKEIMIDEYQDTNNIQEEFINLIANNNVYMVGDIKQSIYRFRGSNPILFRTKYDKYSEKDGGIKIDLTKNFRSRYEVLDNINKIFNLIMDNELGGAKYIESHNMIFGNSAYEEEKEKENYDCEILNYENESDSDFSNVEIEAFTIANDIKNKMSRKIKVFDKKTSKLRDANYSDFVIILDRSKYFENYKKIFEYLNIPFTILRDENLSASSELSIIKNIIDFIIKINSGEYDEKFKYDFLSIGRSFLYECDDNYLFEMVTNNKIFESNIYKDFNSIDSINTKSVSEIFLDILEVTDFYNKIYKIGDYKNINVKISKLFEIAKTIEKVGTLEDFREYLEETIENDFEIKYTSFSSNSKSVKIMTIHKSKGLEYPFCYFADLNHDFNTSDIKAKFINDEKYGIILPPSESDNSILKNLLKYKFEKEEVSEKIRLLYVALTRAREKMIIVLPRENTKKFEKNRSGAIKFLRRLKFKSLASFFYAIEPYFPNYFSDVNISDLNLTKNYLFNKKEKVLESKSFSDIEVKEVNLNYSTIKNKSFSKDATNFISLESKKSMEFGTLMHEIFELIDFKNFDESEIEDKFAREKVKKFLNSDLLNNVKKANIYKELEFLYEEEDAVYHGVIDLLLEYDDHFDIIDYKLKNVDDAAYESQLKGYKTYIENRYQKNVNLYLYSIINETFKQIT